MAPHMVHATRIEVDTDIWQHYVLLNVGPILDLSHSAEPINVYEYASQTWQLKVSLATLKGTGHPSNCIIESPGERWPGEEGTWMYYRCESLE